MGQGLKVDVIGIPQLLRDLAGVGTDLRGQVSQAASASARAIASQARALAPRRTGTLASAITFEGKDLNWRAGVEDRSYPSRGGNTAHQNPWVYGVWYELGFKTRRIAKHPFMGPAADSEQPRFFARAEQLLDRVLG